MDIPDRLQTGPEREFDYLRIRGVESRIRSMVDISELNTPIRISEFVSSSTIFVL